MNWFKENWFKVSVLVILIGGIAFFTYTSNNKSSSLSKESPKDGNLCSTYKVRVESKINDYNSEQKYELTSINNAGPEMGYVTHRQQFGELFFSEKANGCLYTRIDRTYLKMDENSDLVKVNSNDKITYETHNLFDVLSEESVSDEGVRTIWRGEPFLPYSDFENLVAEYKGNISKTNHESKISGENIESDLFLSDATLEEKPQPIPQPTPKPTPPQQPKSYTESWISDQSGIDGWAYDDNKGYNVELTFMSVNNFNTFTATSNSSIYGNPAYDAGAGCNGRCYQQGSFLWMKRDDAAGELRNKGVDANIVYGFSFSASGYAHTDYSVPKDDYVLIKATYNGKSFKLPSSKYYQRVCGVNENGIECLSL